MHTSFKSFAVVLGCNPKIPNTLHGEGLSSGLLLLLVLLPGLLLLGLLLLRLGLLLLLLLLLLGLGLLLLLTGGGLGLLFRGLFSLGGEEAGAILMSVSAISDEYKA